MQARQLYGLTEAESQASLELGLSVGKQRCGMGDTVFLAPFVNVLSVMQRSRKRSSQEVAQLRRLTRRRRLGLRISDFGPSDFGFPVLAIIGGRQARPGAAGGLA